MARLQECREGTQLEVKGRLIDFSLYPTVKKTVDMDCNLSYLLRTRGVSLIRPSTSDVTPPRKAKPYLS